MIYGFESPHMTQAYTQEFFYRFIGKLFTRVYKVNEGCTFADLMTLAQGYIDHPRLQFKAYGQEFKLSKQVLGNILKAEFDDSSYNGPGKPYIYKRRKNKDGVYPEPIYLLKLREDYIVTPWSLIPDAEKVAKDFNDLLKTKNDLRK